MDFLYAVELKKRFTCYGHFYEWVLMDGTRAKCRSVLEIVDTTIPQERPSAISLMQPDAVVIMMNPGSSHPKDPAYVDEAVAYPSANGAREKNLVLTQPDNTQYQVMRVAVSKGWRHIRVLNLSDLRNPKSVGFIRTTESLREIVGGHFHSIFCPERTAECAHALRRKGAGAIMLGWGQDPGLIPLAEQCLQRIEGEPVCSVPSEVHPLLNAHPSPMLQAKKLLWLETIIGALEA